MKKHIQDFINYNYKKLTFFDFFIGFFMLAFFTFLIVPINVQKPIITYFSFFLDIAYIIASIIIYKFLDGQKRTFLFDGVRNEFISIMFCLFVAGFMKRYLLFFFLELILIFLFGAITVVLGCSSIKKKAFSEDKLKKADKISVPIIMAFSISGVIAGRILFSLIDVQNGFMFGMLMIVGILLGGNGGYFLKVYLLICQEKKISNKFIDYLNDADE